MFVLDSVLYRAYYKTTFVLLIIHNPPNVIRLSLNVTPILLDFKLVIGGTVLWSYLSMR